MVLFYSYFTHEKVDVTQLLWRLTILFVNQYKRCLWGKYAPRYKKYWYLLLILDKKIIRVKSPIYLFMLFESGRIRFLGRNI